MKKLMAILCVTALLCGCSSKNKSSSNSDPAASSDNSGAVTTEGDTGSGSQEGTTANNAPTDPNLENDPSEIIVNGEKTDMSSVANVSWDKIYRSALEDFKKSKDYSEDARFSVYDVNDDKVPELIISYGGYGDKTFLVKTLSESVYTEFEPITGCDQLSYVMDRSLLTTVRYHDDIQVQNVQLYRIKSGVMANVGSFQRSATAAKEDGVPVTDEKYDEDYNHFISGVIKSMGLDFGFDDATIDAALGNMEDWKKGYEAVLNDYLKYKKANDDNHFSLYDINGDETPELFVSGAYHYAPYVDIYSWNGCVVPVGSFGTDGTIGFAADSKELISIVDNPSYTAGSVYSFDTEGNYKFSELFNYGNTENSKNQDPNVEVIYKVNGELTDKSDYEKQVKENVKKSYYVLGKDNDLTADTIKSVGSGKYKQASKN
ncbi:hypothetical protein [Ruminococcus flavefaciens]|uniref:hypothetical protein n=1 Tax=Ruminococcus flavefaciens TaxID=1265 RepID=UPI0026EA5E2A|nr:hypothetical protein [Ruminococcus flavefaciens]